jgi:hypothetical protein
MTLARYFSAPVMTMPRWLYDLDKPAHVALITCALVALFSLAPLTAAMAAAVAYFAVGKLLVALELIPHGAHKPFGAEAIHWIGELALCALVPALVLSALLVPVALVALYALTILATPELPS